MLEHFFECYSDLSGLIPCPVLGSITPLFIPNSRIRPIRLIGLCASLITFLYPPVPRIQFDPSTAKSQFVESLRWLPYENIHFSMGIDGLSLFFVILTTFLIPICISVGWSGMRSFGKEYITASLIREFLMIAVSRMLDPLLFYVLPESVPIPMLIIIGVWGSRQRKIKAAYQFFLYTSLGSVFMLLAIPLILLQTGTTDLQILLTTEFSERRQIFLWIASFASFAVKVPMVPVHIWLPEAHVEAPTAGSVILAGIPLKLGTYGFLRFSIPMFPEATLRSTPFIYTPSAIAIIYTPSTTSRQIDLKKIIAYSPVAHMNLVTIGMSSSNIQGIGGSIPPMSSHGLVPPALFLCVGVLYDRHQTRLVRYYGGSVSTMPNLPTISFSSTLANMSSPGTSSFLGEFPISVGAFQRNSLVATLAALGMILGAAYSLWLYNRAVSGNFKPDFLHKFSDPNGREVSIFLPFLVGLVRMGVHPKVFPDCMHTSVSNLVQHGKFH
nr:NADH dehydrogenase subunit 4 [Myoxanthus exasperatus]